MAKISGLHYLIATFVLISTGYVAAGFLDVGVLKQEQLKGKIKTLTAGATKKKKKFRPWSRSFSRYGKGEENEMSGFLGIGSLVDPIIILKRPPAGQLQAGETPIPEVECRRTRFMSPFREQVVFVGNGSIQNRRNPVCTWYYMGTEACTPMLDCPFFSLNSTNEICEEYVEVYDGHRGYKKYCGNEGPVNVSAADSLRDLYVRFVSTKWEGPENPDLVNILKFNCTVTCSGQGDGQPLPIARQPKVNPLCTCGKKVNRNKIINGTDALKGEFPWLVSLVEARTRQPFCGGSLVNDRIVLTAAHCIKGMFMDVRNVEVVLNGQRMDSLSNSFVHLEKSVPKKYDDATLKRLDETNNSIRFPVEEIIIHPLYVTETNDFDVAVLRLPSPINYEDVSHNLIPTCLPKLGSYLRTFTKANATISGWGLTEPEGGETSILLQKLVVPVIPPRRCKILYAHRINRRMLCAGYEDGGRDSCMGDSGGPLVYEERPQVWYQIGTVSWGEGCATKANPGVYIRTTETGQWINYHSNMNDAVWCSVPP